MRGAWTLAVATVLLLSGCTNAPEEAESELGLGARDTPTGGGRGTADAAPPTSTLLHPLAANVSRTLWANGTFQAVDACNPVGCALDTYQHSVALAEHVPAGIATRIHAELKFPSGPVSLGPPLFLYADGEGGTVYSYGYDAESTGDQKLDLLVMEETPSVAIYVDTYWPTFQGAATDYTLRIDVEAVNGTTPAAVPVEAELAAGQWVTASAVDGKAFTVLVYGPDERVAARYDARTGGVSFQLPDRDGNYVLVATATASDVRYATNGTAPELRALGLSFEGGPGKPAAGQPVEWTFNVEGDPLTVGLYARVTETPGGYLHTVDEPMRLTGPQGLLLDDTFSCTVCLNFVPGDFVFTAAAPVGDPKLVAGAYQASYEPQGSAGLEVGEFVVRYVR